MSNTLDASPRKHFEGIEALRAFAAVSIIFFHVSALVGDNFPLGFSFFRTHFGMGVPLFFVISGFSLSYGYFGRLQSMADVEQYLVRRFARIAPLFYAMLVFQVIYLYFRVNVTFSPGDILANALFVFNFVPSLTDGIVPASWSIGIEMVFYVVFPFVVLLCTSIRRTAVALLFAIFVATKYTADMNHATGISQSFNYHNVMANVPFFMWGVLAYHVHQWLLPRIPVARVHLAGIGLSLVAVALLLVMYKDFGLAGFFYKYDMTRAHASLWGLPFFFLCLGAAIFPTWLISNAATRYVGKISFSVYLLHPNITWELGQHGVYMWLHEKMPSHYAWSFFLSMAVAIGIVVALASVTYELIEKPGMEWGKRLFRKSVAGAPVTA
nr:acyltransferase [Luteibacter rhizovicinus]